MQTPEMAEGFSSSPGLMPGSLCVSSGVSRRGVGLIHAGRNGASSIERQGGARTGAESGGMGPANLAAIKLKGQRAQTCESDPDWGRSAGWDAVQSFVYKTPRPASTAVCERCQQNGRAKCGCLNDGHTNNFICPLSYLDLA
jgi:hypothetical protein